MPKQSEKIIIRQYQESDRTNLLEVLIEFGKYIAETDTKKYCRPFSSKEDAGKYLDFLITDNQKREGGILVAEENGKLAGFIQYTLDRHKDDQLYSLTHKPGDHGWIGELYIKPQYRGQGIAKKLVEKVEKYFKGKGCISSRINSMAGNELALSVYVKLGYKPRDIELSKDL